VAFQLKVNGQARAVDADSDTPLLWVLRDNLGLTGTKFGCGIAQCGACTVFLDGKPLRSCSLPVFGGRRGRDNDHRGHFRARERGGATRVGHA
jgi:isoquinoline 1-oxidoreductase subunit alpha